MSAYNGRRGVNVSRYVAELNTNASPPNFDPLEAPANLEDDLAIFANSDFIDWNGGSNNFDPNASLDFGFGLDQKPSMSSSIPQPDNAHTAAGSGTDTGSGGDSTLELGNFEFADFPGFPNPIVDTSMQSVPQVGHYPVGHAFNSPVGPSMASIPSGFDQSTGTKRKLEHIEPHSEQAIDEAARNAAEEDKRRRNTAASARFRVKKKQREQALEKSAKEMKEKVSILETRIQQLETENTWLKGLITEKNGGKATSSEVSAMLKKHIENNSPERSPNTHTDGVGTQAEDTKA